MMGPYSPDVASMSTDKLVQLGWHPKTLEELDFRYAWRRAYHERMKAESGPLARIYHEAAATFNSFLYSADI